ATGEYGNLAEAGIVDPGKVTRSAVTNAASIAGLLLTTETLVVEKPKAPEPAAAGGDGPGPGGPHRPGVWVQSVRSGGAARGGRGGPAVCLGSLCLGSLCLGSLCLGSLCLGSLCLGSLCLGTLWPIDYGCRIV